MHRLNKKYSLIIIGLLFSFTRLLGQEETVVTTTEEKGLESVNYKYFDIKDFEMKTMYKFTPPSFGFSSSGFGVSDFQLYKADLAIESKISHSISLEAVYTRPSLGFDIFSGNVRYYLNKKAGSKGINNLIGTHFLAGIDHSFSDQPSGFVYRNLHSSDLQLKLGYGYQGKIENTGYYNALASVNYSPKREEINIALGLNWGFGWGRARWPKGVNGSFGLIPKFEIEKQLFKISELGFSWGSTEQRFGVDLGYERSLGRDLSVNLSLSAGVGRVDLNQENINDYKYKRLAADVELRYYFNRTKRLRQGENLRALDGFYALLGASDIFTTHNAFPFTNGIEDDRTVQSPSRHSRPFLDQAFFKAGLGYQKRLGKHGFVDISMAPGYGPRTDFNIVPSVKLGINF